MANSAVKVSRRGTDRLSTPAQKKPQYIETVPARGYRFLLRVELEAPSSPVNAQTQALLLKRKPAKARKELRVGILHSLTGTMAWTESPVVDTTLLAIEEINGQGGILGREIQPVVIDGESDETTFARQAERLIAQEQVCIIFGCWTSASRKSVLPIVEKQDHLLIYPTQYEGMEQCPNVFYTGAAPNQQIVPAVRWAFGFLGKKRFFLAGWNSVYSRAANAVIRDEVERLGGEIIGEEYVLPVSTEVTRVVRTIAQSEPGVIFNSLVGDTNLFTLACSAQPGLRPQKSRRLLQHWRDRVAEFVDERNSGGLWCLELFSEPGPPREPSALIQRINILGKPCDWARLSKVGNSRSSGVQKNRFVPNLIPVLAPRQPGLNSLLGFSGSGTGTGPNSE